MITSINNYKLNSKVSDYAEGSLLKFSANSYQWAADFGMHRIFRNEKYYWADDSTFLGRKCNEPIIAAVDGLICKIAFRFHDTKEEECVQYREKLYRYLTGQMGTNHEQQEIDSTKLFIWSADEGNVIMELGGYDTSIILTSSLIRNAKRLFSFTLGAFFGRLFRK